MGGRFPIECDARRQDIRPSDPATLDPDSRYAIGVGSVGQPRDYDARACYVICHPAADRVEFRRIPYDIKKAQARFLEAGLSDFDAERIAMDS